VRFAFLDVERANHRLDLLCRVMEVSRSGYYRWRKAQQQPCERILRDRCLLSDVQRIYDDNAGRYGAPRVFEVLRKAGVKVSRKRVARLMRAQGLRGVKKRRYRSCTNSEHDDPIADNLLGRDFNKKRFGEAWVGDVTYIRTDEDWLFLAVVIDVATRRVVGHAMSNRISADLAAQAFQRAVDEFGAPEMFHSDRGVEYAARSFRELLRRYDVVQSMSRKGNCWDNALAESFFASLKNELVHQRRFSTRNEARTAVFEYVVGYYNRVRLHSSLGFMTPVEFHAQLSV